MRRVYVIGSMKNPNIPKVASQLRDAGHEAFDDWYAVGPDADDYWRDYEKARGRSYLDALEAWHANHVFRFDREHLNRCNAGVLVLPAGRSAHMELGFLVGQQKPAFILLDKEQERWDIMYRFATGVVDNVPMLIERLKEWA